MAQESFFSSGSATAIAVPVGIHGVTAATLGLKNLFSKSDASAEESPGKRQRNWLPDKGEPNSTQTNNSGNTTKKYGPDGNVQKEYNEGHTHPNTPPHERVPHVHDYKPNPRNPPGRGTRQDGRAPKKE
ncbi:hypothetical protein [Chitinophaga sp.]|uniref:hypothetical protein n=1 Tax=Chitinophaga sp. TaxID=1869181 RepID=UPI0031D8DF1A